MFEGLAQHFDLRHLSTPTDANVAETIVKPLVHLFAGRPAKLAFSVEAGGPTLTGFYGLKEYSGNNSISTDRMALRGMTPLAMLQKM